MKKAISLAIATLAVIPAITLAQTGLVCKDFEGKWEGKKSGSGYQGPITITFKDDCKYTWVGSAGPITDGQLTIKSKESWYSNQAGSRGKVFRKDNELKWENTWTGNSYEVIVKKVP